MTRCLHITRARVCCDPSLPDDSGVTWCSDRARCGVKDDARPRHLATLASIAARGDRYGFQVYMAMVTGAEGFGSAKALKDAFIESRGRT